MNINPNITSTVNPLGIDLKKSIADPEQQGGGIENVTVKTPQLSLENVMPKGQIIVRTPEKFDLDKEIEEFHDIKDTKKIAKICKALEKHIDEESEKFSEENIGKLDDVYEAHRNFIDAINNKSDKFVNKITQWYEIDPVSTDAVFNEYIDPMIQYMQKTFSYVDRRPEVKKAYKFHKETAQDETLNNATLEERLKKAADINSMSILLMELEELHSSNPAEYERLAEIAATRMDSLSLDKNESKQVTEEHVKPAKENAAVKCETMDAKKLQAEIEKLTQEDLVTDKFGMINNVLAEMAKNNSADYAKLNEAFTTKIIALSEEM